MSTWHFAIVDYDALPPEIDRRHLSNNGSGKEYASYLLAYKDGALHSHYSDAMEPEDVRFCRDLNWIKTLLDEVANHDPHPRHQRGAAARHARA